MVLQGVGMRRVGRDRFSDNGPTSYLLEALQPHDRDAAIAAAMQKKEVMEKGAYGVPTVRRILPDTSKKYYAAINIEGIWQLVFPLFICSILFAIAMYAFKVRSVVFALKALAISFGFLFLRHGSPIICLL